MRDKQSDERKKMHELIREREVKRNMEMEILEKARRTVGLSPVTEADFARHGSGIFGQPGSEEEARWMAAKEFLMSRLGLNKEEVNAMEYVRVFTPRREESKTVYVEMKERKDVVTIYSRTYIMKKGDTVRNHIPPEFYAQYTAMEHLCYTWRQQNKVKTSVRIGEYGLEVWKKIGSRYVRVDRAALGALPEVETQSRRVERNENGEQGIKLWARPGHEEDEVMEHEEE